MNRIEWLTNAEHTTLFSVL